jgi:hypothetical protein
MKIVFLVGSVGISGGNYVVFQHALYARARGHEVTIAVMQRFAPADLAWHPGLTELRLVHLDDLGDARFDIALATWWRTALELHRIDSRQYAYFVQSIESRFFDASQDAFRRLVDRTYEMRLPGITEASWIRQYLAQRYGSVYPLARNGIRKDLYLADGPRHAARVPGHLRVLVEGGFAVPFKNTARTVRLARRARAFETWLLTMSDVPWYPGVRRVFSRVPINEVPAVYRSCDVIVKLSLVEGMFGPPLEMFHCGGTAIVYDVSGHDEYIVHGQNSLVAKMGDEAAVVGHLRRLRDDPRLLADLKAGALDTARAWPDWEQSSALFLAHLEGLLACEPVTRDRLVNDAERIRDEFAQQLHAGNGAASRKAGLSSALPGIGRLKDAVRPYSRLLGYITEGYR